MHACHTFSLAPARSLAPPMSASHPLGGAGEHPLLSPSYSRAATTRRQTASSVASSSSQLVDVDLAHLFNADVIGSPTPEGRVSAGVGTRNLTDAQGYQHADPDGPAATPLRAAEASAAFPNPAGDGQKPTQRYHTAKWAAFATQTPLADWGAVLYCL